ncbi:MAG: hypothetical protein KA479_03535 [Saprospiraceae bacterium]|nr:hypothetical protein [Saprospiraceae bacterium]
MTILWLFIGLITFTLTAVLFYMRQNAAGTIGGPISRPKTIWLFWALFYYYFLSIWIYFELPAGPLSLLLKLFILSMGLRALIQPIFLYVTTNWTPFYGISFNLLVGFGISVYLVHFFYSGIDWSAVDCVHSTYLMGGALALYTDSYYAYRFHQIVGEQTKGNQAIWYASHHDPAFNRINRITAYVNSLFFILLLMVLLQISQL